MRGLLKRAVESNEVLEMIYQNNKGEFSHRMIQVMKLDEESFCAYCFTRKQQRTFKLTSVLSIGPARKVRKGA